MKSYIVKTIDKNQRISMKYFISLYEAEKSLLKDGFYMSSGIYMDLKGRRAGIINMNLYNQNDVCALQSALVRCLIPISKTTSSLSEVIGKENVR